MLTSTTPRSTSPVKGASMPEHGEGDISMMVEPPSEFIGEQSENPEEETVRLLPQTFKPQPLRQQQQQQQAQVLHYDRAQSMPAPKVQDRRFQTRTPEPQKRRSQKEVQRSPSTPGHIVPFDWDDFELRYQKALTEADEQEKELVDEFDRLVKYFNAWASASSAHDNERAVKRLQTRERHVRISEQALLQKKQHLSEVVKAFQSALALLSTT